MKLFLAITCFCIFLYVGCKPNSDTPCRTAHIFAQDFSAEDKNKLHFAGTGDTIRYINSAGDSIWCIGAMKMAYYQTFAVKNNPDCVDDSIGFTVFQFSYSDTLNKLQFSIKATHLDSLIKITANNSVFYLSLKKIGVNDSVSWFDTLQFGNRKFYQINSFVNTNGDSLYYNSAYGMLALKQGVQRFYLYSFNNY
jgi:hypothetical protein